ncbi:MAG: thioredoxin family protein [Chloroflexi bacterium]|nr:thioredoxin family protein [Chloroflexota bacterium]
MAATPSTMIALGTVAPSFTLPDTVSGKEMSLTDLKSDRARVIMFICNHCPYVKHVQRQLVQLARDYQPKGVSFVAISSNDVAQYPEDGPGPMKELAERLEFPFPYLYDETQDVARAYQAACTPDIYVFDKHLQLTYRGQLDDSRPSNPIPVTGTNVRLALDNILAGQPVSPAQKPSVGCSIKWKNS